MPNNPKLLSDDISELFHYTTMDGFKSIYKERKFWATHYKDLNDSSELGQFKEKPSEFIQPTILEIFEGRMRNDAQFSDKINNHGGIDAVVKQEAATQLNNLHRHTFGERGHPDTFICSFCTHEADPYSAKNGLLSQWRGYGTGGGVAIVLDTYLVEERMRYEKVIFGHPINHIGDVTYDDDDAKMKKEFHEVFDRLPEWICETYDITKPPPDLEEKFFKHFVLGSTLVKHHCFHEENEVRIVVSLWPTSPDSIFYKPEAGAIRPKESKAIKYRPKGDREICYIELFGDEDLPIKRIIVGPSRLQNFHIQTICELVKDDSRHIEVVESEMPFSG